MFCFRGWFGCSFFQAFSVYGPKWFQKKLGESMFFSKEKGHGAFFEERKALRFFLTTFRHRESRGEEEVGAFSGGFFPVEEEGIIRESFSF